VAVARALANRPRLVLADEPTGNLDSRTGKEIVALLRELARSEATTIVIVTHDPGIARSADLVFELEDGHLKGTPVLSGPPVVA
jgi:putative ABC transport system ATP-binding protein